MNTASLHEARNALLAVRRELPESEALDRLEAVVDEWARITAAVVDPSPAVEVRDEEIVEHVHSRRPRTRFFLLGDRVAHPGYQPIGSVLLEPGVVRHNAYVLGFVDGASDDFGASDYRFGVRLDSIAYRGGFAGGQKARAAAFKVARFHRHRSEL